MSMQTYMLKKNASIDKNEVDFIKSIVISVFLMVVFTFYNVLGTTALFVVGIGILVLCVFSLDIPTLIFISCVLAPNLMAIKMLGNANALFGYFVLLIFLKYLLIRKKLIINIQSVIFFVTIIVTFIIYQDTSLITIAIRCVAFFVVFPMIFSEEWSKSLEFRDKILRAYLWGILLCILCGFIYFFMSSANIFGGYFSGIRNDRNYFSSLMSGGIAIGILYLSYNPRSNIVYKIIVPLAIFAGVLSGSRTFMLSMCLILILIMSLLTTKGKRKYPIILICIMGICMILFGEYIFPSLQSVLERFTDDTVEGGNGRIEAWIFYIRKVFSSPVRLFFGNGNANMYVKMGEIGIVEHNSYVQLLSTAGITGTIAMISCFWKLKKKVLIAKGRFRLKHWIPLLCSLFCYFNISSMFSDNFNYAILIGFCVADYCIRKEKQIRRVV